jgi:hypothetical protein
VIEADHASADSFSDGGAKEKGGEKIERRGPQDGQFRRQDAGGNDRGDAVGGVVKSVEEVEGQRDQDRDQN